MYCDTCLTLWNIRASIIFWAGEGVQATEHLSEEAFAQGVEFCYSVMKSLEVLSSFQTSVENKGLKK